MHKDKVIALANENGISRIIDKSLCPVCLSVNVPIDIWLANRSIDILRPHSRKLFKALHLRTPDDISSQSLCSAVLKGKYSKRPL